MLKLFPGYKKILREHPFLFGPAVVAFIGFLYWAANETDFIISLFREDSALVKTIDWFAHHPFWFAVMLLVWALGSTFLIWWNQAYGLRKQFGEDWKKTKGPRQVLRDLIHPAHAGWTGSPSSFAAVTRFIEKAGFPEDLPFREEERRTRKLQEYAEIARTWWVEDRGQLLEFCMALCPERGETSLLKTRQRKQFYDARMMLSNFWDEWGRRCYDDGAVEEKVLRPRFQSWELTLLTYLEIALALRNNEQFPGKQGLFQVGREVAEKNKL